MSKRNEKFCPVSLARHFEAPDGYTGNFAWMCGYSADAAFMNDAAFRFTRLTDSSRASQGIISIAIMLDPHNEQLLPAVVPGVLHLPIIDSSRFRLMHAKVALLAFRSEADEMNWLLRLIVSTGNWTRQTVEESLDLVWKIDVSREDLRSERDSRAQDCADIGAAWDLLRWLQRRYDTRGLTAADDALRESRPQSSSELLSKWVGKTKRFAQDVTPRFFDNRRASLLEQLPILIHEQVGSTRRNYLAMASGFYETAKKPGTVPAVLTKIVAELQSQKLIASTPEVAVFVNPQGCQAVASSVSAIKAANWTVRKPSEPTFFSAPRSLHAKFLFSFHYRKNSNLCNSAWLYLGSGNLTGPGFSLKMSKNGGNLEAGVVFGPKNLRWKSRKGVAPELVATNLLPIHDDGEIVYDDHELQPGTDMPEPVLNFAAAPVAAFLWQRVDNVAWLRSSHEMETAFDVIDENDHPCLYEASDGFRWVGAQPQQVLVRWQQDGEHRSAFVPIIDEFGRFAAAALRPLGIDEIWSQLENFPMPPNNGEDDPGGEPDGIFAGQGQSNGATTTSRYPVREMMQLIENIAAKQTAIRQADWLMWCSRLEQTLSCAKKTDSVVEEFRRQKLNPLSPLSQAPFRPDFALDDESKEGQRYTAALESIAKAWEVDQLEPLGGPR